MMTTGHAADPMPAVPEGAQVVGEGAHGGPGPSVALGEKQVVESLFKSDKVIDEKGRRVLEPAAHKRKGLKNKKKAIVAMKEPSEPSEPEEDEIRGEPGQPEPADVWPDYIVIGDMVGPAPWPMTGLEQLQEAGEDLAGHAEQTQDIMPEDAPGQDLPLTHAPPAELEPVPAGEPLRPGDILWSPVHGPMMTIEAAIVFNP